MLTPVSPRLSSPLSLSLDHSTLCLPLESLTCATLHSLIAPPSQSIFHLTVDCLDALTLAAVHSYRDVTQTLLLLLGRRRPLLSPSLPPPLPHPLLVRSRAQMGVAGDSESEGEEDLAASSDEEGWQVHRDSVAWRNAPRASIVVGPRLSSASESFRLAHNAIQFELLTLCSSVGCSRHKTL